MVHSCSQCSIIGPIAHFYQPVSFPRLFCGPFFTSSSVPECSIQGCQKNSRKASLIGQSDLSLFKRPSFFPVFDRPSMKSFAVVFMSLIRGLASISRFFGPLTVFPDMKRNNMIHHMLDDNSRQAFPAQVFAITRSCCSLIKLDSLQRQET